MKANQAAKRRIACRRVACLGAALASLAVAAGIAQAQTADAPYPRMAPLEQYMMDRDAEIALTRSAAPSSISADAQILVLGPKGYETAVEGRNGFVCITERSWANTFDSPEFWNPKHRSPNCFNAAAARTFMQVYLMKTKLVLEGKSKAEVAAATALAFGKERAARTGARRNGLHDVEATVFERPGKVLASASDVFCPRRCR